MKNKRIVQKPEVGILFVVDDKIYIESTPLAEAGVHADCKDHGGSHLDYWQKLVRAGSVPESEYDEHPRGRVIFNVKTQQFTIFADDCILRRKKLVDSIRRELHLPTHVKTKRDTHYRCPKCMGLNSAVEEED